MSGKILWLDNDSATIKPYVMVLEDHSYKTTAVTSVSKAQELLESNLYDLFILDVMVPTISADEEKLYPPEVTRLGQDTGILFYKLMKKRLEETGTPILIMTVRLGVGIKNSFIDAGLPSDCFATKLSLRRIPDFLNRIETILAKYRKKPLND